MEELDSIDWPRFLRARQVTMLLQVEDRRRAFLRGTLTDMTEDDWKTIERSEQLLQKYGKND